MTKLVTLDRLAELKICYDARTGMFTRDGKLVAGAPRPDGYRRITIDRRVYWMHRLAWFMMTGKWPVTDIIHANYDRADNRWQNLRLASISKRAHRRSTTSKLGVRGVHLAKAGYRASIRVRGKVLRLGTFSTAEAAHAAYAAAAIQHYGPEARTQ